MLDGNFGDYNAISCLSLYVFTKKLRLPTCNLFSDLMLVYKLYMSDIRFIVRRICLSLILSSSLLTHVFIIQLVIINGNRLCPIN